MGVGAAAALGAAAGSGVRPGAGAVIKALLGAEATVCAWAVPSAKTKPKPKAVSEKSCFITKSVFLHWMRGRNIPALRVYTNGCGWMALAPAAVRAATAPVESALALPPSLFAFPCFSLCALICLLALARL